MSRQNRHGEELRRHNAKYSGYRSRFITDSYDRIVFYLRKDADADLIRHVRNYSSMGAYIKKLVADDIVRQHVAETVDPASTDNRMVVAVDKATGHTVAHIALDLGECHRVKEVDSALEFILAKPELVETLRSNCTFSEQPVHPCERCERSEQHREQEAE